MTRRVSVVLAVSVLVTGLAAPTGAHASTADCLADLRVTVPVPQTPYDGPPRTDPLGITPADTSYGILSGIPSCNSSDYPVVLVERPDGSRAHRVELDYYADYIDLFGWIGADTFDYATVTGPWRINTVYQGTASATLTHPVSYTIKRASRVTLSVPPATLPAKPRATGTVRYWNYAGQLVPSPGRRVDIRGRDQWANGVLTVGPVLASTTTDSYGRYAVTLPLTASTYVYAAVPSTSTLGWTTSHWKSADTLAQVLHPTYVSGTVKPTYATVVHAGTLMSTWGHLSVMTSSGAIVPYAGQKVVVQTRPRGDTTKPYRTIGDATTNSKGYFYTNWDAASDADARVAFLSPYQTVLSSYRWIGAVDVS